MAGVNKVILVGNLGKDPEVAYLRTAAKSSASASPRRRLERPHGERKEKTEWHNIVIFNENLARSSKSYCKKGSKVYLEGQLQTRKWQDQIGQ